MIPEQFQQLLDKFSRGECTPAEQDLIIEWYERIGEKESHFTNVQEKIQVEERMWASIVPTPVQERRKWLRVLGRAAVVTIPLLIAGFLFLQRTSADSFLMPAPESAASTSEQREYSNETAKPLRVPLPDGSFVVLQPASRILLANNFDRETREVELTGGGFFDVKPNAEKPFLVYANEVVTRVIGTSFCVKAFENDKEVTVSVRSGKVSVYTNKNKSARHLRHSAEVVLTPNQKMVYHRPSEVISKKLVEKPEIVLPNSNLFRMQFDNAEISEILDVLSENYGVKISYDKNKLRACRLTTSMSDEGLYERIDVICKAIGASYSIDDDAVITIESNGC